MTDRSVEVHLLLRIEQYRREANDAGGVTDRLTSRVRGLDDSVVTVTGDLDKAGGKSKSFAADLVTVQRESQSASAQVRGLDTGVIQLGRTMDNGGNAIDRYSGRLTLALQLAAALGPALVPIGAVGVPALTGLASAGALSAFAVGGLVGSLQGVGDAVKAVNDYKADQTAVNLEKAQRAMASLGPDAQQLVMALRDAGPMLTELRDAGARGWAPGLIDALTEARDLAPDIAAFMERTGEVGGRVLADGVESLSDERWREFREFLVDEAPETLPKVASLLGSLSHGAAEMWMSFDPSNDAFLDWINDVGDGFDDWASSADGRRDIESFLAYARENGPKVEDFFVSLVDTTAQIIQAAAPLGGPTLQSLTAVLDIIGRIADSDAGTPLLAMAAALSVYNRALKVTEALQKSTFGQSAAGRAIGGGIGSAVGGEFAEVRRLPAAYREVAAAQRDLADAEGKYNRARSTYIAQLQVQNRLTAQGYTMSHGAQARLADSLGRLEMANYGVQQATDRVTAAETGRARAFGASAAAAGRVAAGVGAMAVLFSGAGDKIGYSNTALLGLSGAMLGPYGAAAGAAVGLTMDLASANDDLAASLEAANQAVEDRNVDALKSNLSDAEKELDDFREKVEQANSKDFFDADTWKAAFDPGVIKSELEGFFGKSELDERAEEAEKLRRELDLLAAAGGGTANALSNLLVDPLGASADAFDQAAASAERFEDIMADVTGVLSERQAWRAVEAAIDDARDAVEENGKAWGRNTEAGRANQEALEEIATTSLTASRNIEDIGKRARYIDRMRDTFLGVADAMGMPKRRAEQLADALGLLDAQKVEPRVDLNTSTAQQREREIRRRLAQLGMTRTDPRLGLNGAEFERGSRFLLQRLRELGNQQADPKAGLDMSKFQSGSNATMSRLRELNGTQANPTVGVNDNASGKLGGIRGLLNSLDGFVATTRVNTVHTTTSIRVAERRAAGGQVFGPGGPRDDMIPALLSNREFVHQVAAVDHYGVGAMYAINERRVPKELLAGFANGGYTGSAYEPSLAQRLADGGQPRGGGGRGEGGRGGLRDVDREARDAAHGIKYWRQRLRETERDLEKMRDAVSRTRDKLDSMRDYRQQIGQGFSPADLAGQGLEGFTTGLQANRNDTNAATRYLQQARDRGLDGALFQFIAGSGDLDLARSFGGMTRRQIANYERQYAGYLRDQRQLGDVAVLERYDTTIARTQKVLDRQEKAVKDLTREVRTIGRHVRDGAREGTRQGNNDRGRRNNRDRRNG